jgi:hypothetical protein
MFLELSINQVKAILLSMAHDKNVSPCLIEKFFEKFLIKKPLPIIGVSFPFVVRCSPNDCNSTAKSEDVVFKNVRRCSYNPNIDSIRLQRCNYEKQQVFYAAAPSPKTNQVSIGMTALLETAMVFAKNKKIKRWYFTLSRWKLNRTLNVFVLPFSARACKRNSDFKQMNTEFKKIIRRLSDNDLELCQYFFEFLEFMSNIFCKAGKKEIYYKISSAFFNAVIKFADKQNNLFFNFTPPSDYKIDGIIYPSANSKAEGMNACLRKETIDNLALECDLAVIYAMQRCPNNPKNITFPLASNESIPDGNGNLHFKNVW